MKINMTYNRDTLEILVKTSGKIWRTNKNFSPYLIINSGEDDQKLYFKDAESILHEEWNTGIGFGYKTTFSNFKSGSDYIPLTFKTLIWIDNTDGEIHMELIPVVDTNKIKKIAWPGPLEFDKQDSDSYTVIPMMLGTIIPNNWPYKVESIADGKYYERSSYMPWWGQIEHGTGYIAIAETPWDGGYDLKHPAGGKTEIGSLWYPSLGKISYTRKIKYIFSDNCDYNSLCKVYRKHIKQQNQFITLEEKSIRNPLVKQLIGSPVIHSSIYYHTESGSDAYDPVNMEKNDQLVSFDKRTMQLKKLKKLGVEKAYLHLDGWGKRGYDNLHPDVLPPCKQAGGWEGMKSLSEACKDLGYIFAIHDQYRDYFLDSETFNKNQAVFNQNNNITVESQWAGGKQTFLCTQFASKYIKRNFNLLKNSGIELKGAYLDVFSLMLLDECFHTEHRMTRKECLEKRRECFNYVRSEEMIISSEEPVDWAIPNLDLVHHSPMALDVPLDGWSYTGKAIGIPVPLLTLVYHECLVVPWFIGKGKWGIPESHDGFLYGMLNGGTGYLDIEADSDEIEKNRILCKLHEQMAHKEMISHEFLNKTGSRQRTTFSDGTEVVVDFESGNYNVLNLVP